jgi:hypothetical protein
MSLLFILILGTLSLSILSRSCIHFFWYSLLPFQSVTSSFALLCLHSSSCPSRSSLPDYGQISSMMFHVFSFLLLMPMFQYNTSELVWQPRYVISVLHFSHLLARVFDHSTNFIMFHNIQFHVFI